MIKIKKALVFMIAFMGAHKLLPIFYPRGSFLGSEAGDWVQWIIGVRPSFIGLLMAAVLLVISAAPLNRLPIWVSAFFGVLTAIGLGVLFFPYNFFEMGIWPDRYRTTYEVAIAVLLLSPWVAFIYELWEKSVEGKS